MEIKKIAKWFLYTCLYAIIWLLAVTIENAAQVITFFCIWTITFCILKQFFSTIKYVYVENED